MEERRKLGEFEIVRELSRSSIASVYEGYQPSLRRKVLIKRLHPQLSGDTEIRARFEREAHALAANRHEHVIHIYDYHASKEMIYLITEWIESGSLVDYKAEHGPFCEKEAIGVALDVLSGLAAAHEAGIIHRDIKPSNLLVSERYGIKITDFGLAQFEGSPTLTQQGAIVGTPAYMAPEILSGGEIDARCDLYSVGVTIYELMTGVNPFAADNVSETLNRIGTLKPPALEGISSQFNRFLAILLEKRPEKRYASAQQAYDALLPIAAEFGISHGFSGFKGVKKVEGAPIKDVQQRSTVSSVIRPVQPAKPPAWAPYFALTVMCAIVLLVFIFQRPAPDDSITPYETEVSGDTVSHSQSSAEQVVSMDTLSGVSNEERMTGESGEVTVPGREIRGERGEDFNPDERSVSMIPEDDEIIADDTHSSGSIDSIVVPPDEIIVLGYGYMMMAVDPWADIYFDDSLIVQTPYDRPFSLPSGEITLEFRHPDFPPVLEVFTIPDGDTLRERVSLMDKIGVIESINAHPWAIVYLNNQYLGQTPIATAQILPLGSYEIMFTHSSLPTKTIILELREGMPPQRITVNLMEE